MKTYINLYRLLFLVLGVGGLINVTNLVFSKNIAWSIWVYASLLITCVITIGFLYLAVRLKILLPEKKFFVSSIIFIYGANQLTTFMLGKIGMNQVKFLAGMNFQALIVAGLIMALFYIGLIVGIYHISQKSKKF